MEEKKQKKKLSYMEKRELEMMEERVQVLEKKIEMLKEMLSLPENFSDHKKTEELSKDLGVSQEKLDQLYERWQTLEEQDS